MAITAHNASQFMRRICTAAPIMPVLVIKDASTATDLGLALLRGGLPILEVTLRTPAALDAIKVMSDLPGVTVGAGTVLNAKDAEAAKDAGAQFAVAPGATDNLIEACTALDLPLLPGAVTASEAMQLLDHGFDFMKFFPAETSGGAAALKALAGPLPQIAFCPTGGITAQNATQYLALPNVICAGGSWIAPASLVEQKNWGAIQQLAADAAQMPSAKI